MRKNKAWREMEANYKKWIDLRDCGNADHLTDKDGNFISENPRSEGKISIGYLEDSCQWIFYRKDLTDQEKLSRILIIENILNELIKKSIQNCTYVPYWSTKLKEEKGL